MWTPNAYVKDAIGNRNYIRIHNEFCSVIHQDPSFRTRDLEEAIQYIKGQNVPDVIRAHDQRPFADRGEWNKEYWALVLSELMDNFSSERVEHIKQVGRHLFGAPATQVAAPSNAGLVTKAPIHPGSASRPYRHGLQAPSVRRPRWGYSYRKGGSPQKKLGAVAIVAGVAVAGAAVIGFKKALLVAGAAVLIGGVIYILKNNKLR